MELHILFYESSYKPSFQLLRNGDVEHRTIAYFDTTTIFWNLKSISAFQNGLPRVLLKYEIKPRASCGPRAACGWPLVWVVEVHLWLWLGIEKSEYDGFSLEYRTRNFPLLRRGYSDSGGYPDFPQLCSIEFGHNSHDYAFQNASPILMLYLLWTDPPVLVPKISWLWKAGLSMSPRTFWRHTETLSELRLCNIRTRTLAGIACFVMFPRDQRNCFARFIQNTNREIEQVWNTLCLERSIIHWGDQNQDWKHAVHRGAYVHLLCAEKGERGKIISRQQPVYPFEWDLNKPISSE